ncbi:hypothetical protein H310_03691 [Aphanomyces invadans]|uniref:Uncharacterized protein n=1 Tax=Aphanomyces invadans TaxID=157072 RepID=A0A024UJQ5_9STRA|nr:hypothetical protein H310_03691 [Aphanomyces invadans]ETW06097.1 hypothetical protein H310_03691 [Aphanomyces invadans]|eukprot:XP_008865874.1 hypothetical protein H310_03691 [Aphanomyces invadans]
MVGTPVLRGMAMLSCLAIVANSIDAIQVDAYAAWAHELLAWTQSIVGTGETDAFTFTLHNATVRYESTPLATSTRPSCAAASHLVPPNQKVVKAMHALMKRGNATADVDTIAFEMQREMQTVPPNILDCFQSNQSAHVARGVWDDLIVRCANDSVEFHARGSLYNVDKSESKQAQVQVDWWGKDRAIKSAATVAASSSGGAADSTGKGRQVATDRLHQSMQNCLADKRGMLTVQSIFGGGWSVQVPNESTIVASYATAFELVVAHAGNNASDTWVRSMADATATALYRAGHACHAPSVGGGCYQNPPRASQHVGMSLAATWKTLSYHQFLVVYSGAIVFGVLVLLSAATLASTQRRHGYTAIPDPIEVDYDSCSSDDNDYY